MFYLIKHVFLLNQIRHDAQFAHCKMTESTHANTDLSFAGLTHN